MRFMMLRGDIAELKPWAEPVDWRRFAGLSVYGEMLTAMEAQVARISSGETSESVWLLEHPPLYSAGTSAKIQDLIEPARFPVFETGRGGQYTYHGPGQRVAYVMLNLTKRGGDVRATCASMAVSISP